MEEDKHVSWINATIMKNQTVRNIYGQIILKYFQMYNNYKKFKKVKSNIINIQKNVRRYISKKKFNKDKNKVNKIASTIRRYFLIKNIKAIKIQRKFRNRSKNLYPYIAKLLKSKKKIEAELEDINTKYLISKTNTSQFLCPITHEVPNIPVFCVTDGHIYNKSDIVNWVSKHQNSPINRTLTYLSDLIPLIKLSNEWNNKIHIKQSNILLNGIWWYEEKAIHWVFNPNISNCKTSPIMTFIDDDPKQRHEISISIGFYEERLYLKINNEFKNTDNRVKYPISNSIKIEINDNVKYFYPSDLIQGCIADIYKDEKVLYEQVPIMWNGKFIQLDLNNDEGQNKKPVIEFHLNNEQLMQELPINGPMIRTNEMDDSDIEMDESDNESDNDSINTCDIKLYSDSSEEFKKKPEYNKICERYGNLVIIDNINFITCQPENNSNITKIEYYKGTHPNKSKPNDKDFEIPWFLSNIPLILPYFCDKKDALTDTGHIHIKISKDDISKLM